MNILRVGVIVEKDNYYGVIVKENDSMFEVEWFNENCKLYNAWWDEQELNFINDPTTDYRTQSSYNITIVFDNTNTEISETDIALEDLELTLNDIEEEYECYFDNFNIHSLVSKLKRFNNSLEYEVFDRETNQSIGYLTIEG